MEFKKTFSLYHHRFIGYKPICGRIKDDKLSIQRKISFTKRVFGLKRIKFGPQVQKSLIKVDRDKESKVLNERGMNLIKSYLLYKINIRKYL